MILPTRRCDGKNWSLIGCDLPAASPGRRWSAPARWAFSPECRKLIVSTSVCEPSGLGPCGMCPVGAAGSHRLWNSTFCQHTECVPLCLCVCSCVAPVVHVCAMYIQWVSVPLVWGNVCCLICTYICICVCAVNSVCIWYVFVRRGSLYVCVSVFQYVCIQENAIHV